MSAVQYTLTRTQVQPSGFVHCWVTMLDGRQFQFDVAPDEFAVFGEARTVDVLAALPGPPGEPYR